MNDRELDKILHRIRIQLDNENLDAFYTGFAKTGSILVEKSMSQFYNIDGFTDHLFQNEAFLDGLERYKIENPFPYVPASVQISYAIVSTAFITHQLNATGFRTRRKQKDMNGPNVKEEIEKIEYNIKIGQSL